MTYQRLAYDDADTAVQMHDDCTACSSSMTLPRRRVDNGAITEPAPSLRYDAFPQQTTKPVIEVSEAAAHLASRLHLHLD
jgi:hypothetical protein